MPRTYPAHPVLGVGAVVWRDGKVLLARRGHAPRRGEWSLPGGVLHLGESVAEAVRREVLEECGVDIEVVDVAAVIDLVERDDGGRVRYHYVVVDVAARWLSGEACAGDDAEAVAWVAPADLGGWGVSDEVRRVVALAAAKLECPPGEAPPLDRMMRHSATDDGSS